MSFRDMYNPFGLRIPSKLHPRQRFAVADTFQAPKVLLLDGYCTPAENQGATPQCAAYAAASFAENVLWRKRGFHKDIDPAPLYKYAKTIDGEPDGEGTYLECALKALLALGTFDKKTCAVKTFGSSWYGIGGASGLPEVKYAVHRYGACLAGFNITDEWFNPHNAVIRGDVHREFQGGHAVLVCGYDEHGVLIMNSWGADYGRDGKVFISNRAFEKQFMYGAVLTHVLDGLE